MLNKCLSKWLLLSFVAWLIYEVSELERLSGVVCASESNLLELVEKHDEQWQTINAIQLVFTRYLQTSVFPRTALSNCYWESNREKSRAIVATLDSFSTDRSGQPVIVEVCEDIFCNGKDLFNLSVPKDKYPLLEIQLCDWLYLRELGYVATFAPEGTGSTGADVHLHFPLPKYFSVHTEQRTQTLLELAIKYPSRIVSSQKNASGDNIIEIAIESHIDNHERFTPWKLKVFINTDKGYFIDAYRYSTSTKSVPSTELIVDASVHKCSEINEKYWLVSDWEVIHHNGDPAIGIKTNFVIDDFNINEVLVSRLEDFRFPTNFPVLALSPGDQPEKIHIWGLENKPIRSFDKVSDFLKYYENECMSSDMLPQANKHLVFRITFVVIGLIMIAVALYMLYAKER